MKLNDRKLSSCLALAITLTPVTALADLDLDASQWHRAELVWSEFVGDYLAQPTLGDDPFQEQLIWNDHYGDYIPAAMAKAEADREYRGQLAWSDFHGDYLPRFVLEPCPSIAGHDAPTRVDGLF